MSASPTSVPSINAAALKQALSSSSPPMVIDVRRKPASTGAAGMLNGAPQAAGLLAITLGLSRPYANDHEMLEHGMIMYDALHAWCRQGKDETRI